MARPFLTRSTITRTLSFRGALLQRPGFSWRYASVCVAIAINACLLFALLFPSPVISSATNITPPEIKDKTLYSIAVDYSANDLTRIRVLPTGCIVRIMLNANQYHTAVRDLCNGFSGFSLTMPFVQGQNVLMFAVDGANAPPVLINAEPDAARIGMCIMAGLFAHLLITFAAARRGYGWTDYLLLHGAMIMGIFHFAVTPHYSFSPDYAGHLDYIRQLASGILPPPYGWQTQQPPLYYVFAALFYVIGGWFGPVEALQMVRVLSLGMYVFLLLACVEILRLCAPRRAIFLVLVAMLSFWPELLLLSSRTSNDLPVALFTALTLLNLLRFNGAHEPRHLLLAGAYACISLIVKGNGILALGAVVIVAAIHAWRGNLWFRALPRRGLAALGCVALLSLLLNFGRTLYFRLVHSADVKWFINLHDPHSIPELVADNSAYRFLTFDFLRFIRDSHSWSNTQAEPQIFWNAFLKSLLLGETGWPATLREPLMFLFFIVIVVAFAQALFRRHLETRMMPCLVMGGCMIVGLIASRFAGGWTVSAHGRYVIMFSVIQVCYYGRALEQWKDEGRELLYASGIALGWCFSLYAMLLMLNLHVPLPL